ncbi:MAG: peptidyl-prolyl cis-trans isomerase [Myxococcales bacterium]|nr:peptidyl-prolyl cis-trans isomerase [Myxococcales bacterium]
MAERGLLRRLLSEPLLHFAVLGAAVFALGRATSAESDVPTVTVDAAVVERIQTALRDKLGREPSPEEVDAALEGWVDGELLYREGLAMGLDRDDPLVRQRVIQKMEYVGTNLDLPPEPDEDTLRAFLAEHPERYAGTPRHDFTIVTLLRGPEDADDSRAQALLQQLREGADPKAVGGRHASGRLYTAANLAGTYGPELAAAVGELPVGEWGLVPMAQGWSLVRHDAEHPGQALPFEQVRNRLQLDWKSYQRSSARRELLDELRARYRVERPG